MKLATDFYLAIGGSRHGELLERYGKSRTCIVPILSTDTSSILSLEPHYSRLHFERYELQYFQISKGRRFVAYFVLDSLPLSGALALINDLESEPEPVVFQR